MWPIVIGLVSAMYCCLSLFSFARRHAESSRFLASNKTLTISRYFRLMALAVTEILLTTPLAIFLIWLNATASPINPWRSWTDTHFDFSRVEQIPAILWRNGSRSEVIAIELSRWVTPVCAITFFCFFGFAEEANRNYHAAMWRVMSLFGVKTKSWPAGSGLLLSDTSIAVVTPVKRPVSASRSYSPICSASSYSETTSTPSGEFPLPTLRISTDTIPSSPHESYDKKYQQKPELALSFCSIASLPSSRYRDILKTESFTV